MRPARSPFGNLRPTRGLATPTARGIDETDFVSRLELPLAWEVLDAPPSELTREEATRANANNLAFLLHGIDIEAAPRAADEQLAEALAPIRVKLDIIIGMLARLSYHAVELPPCRSIELGERQIAWLSDAPLPAAAWLRIAIYFDESFREPIVIFAQAAGSLAVGTDCQYRNEAVIAQIGEPVIGDLARLALLVQRRQRTRRGHDVGARRTW